MPTQTMETVLGLTPLMLDYLFYSPKGLVQLARLMLVTHPP